MVMARFFSGSLEAKWLARKSLFPLDCWPPDAHLGRSVQPDTWNGNEARPERCRRRQSQQCWHTLWLGQAEQAVADAGQAGHQAGTFDAAGKTALPAPLLDVRQDIACQAVRLVAPARFAQHGVGLEEQFQISQVAVTERMVVAESVSQRRLQGRGNLLTDRRIVEKRAQ